jgi:hypothetical protein
MVYGGRVWGVRPVASHLRIVPDFCYWRGLLVLAGDQADNASGQPQSGLWFGGVDDLWTWGKPAGWGGSTPWAMASSGSTRRSTCRHGDTSLTSFPRASRLTGSGCARDRRAG